MTLHARRAHCRLPGLYKKFGKETHDKLGKALKCVAHVATACVVLHRIRS